MSNVWDRVEDARTLIRRGRDGAGGAPGRHPPATLHPRSSTPMDRILIRELAARCVLGLSPEERREKQDVLVSLALSADLREAGHSDHVEDAIDYRAVKKRVLALVERSQFRLLEALAEAIAGACLEDDRIASVQVTVDKPGALRFARSVAVEIVRTRARSLSPPVEGS